MKNLTLMLALSLFCSACGQSPSMPAAPARLMARSLEARASQAGYHSTGVLRIRRADSIPQALAALRTLQARTRAEAGNRAFLVFQDQQDPQTIVIWEIFKHEAAFQQHLQSPHLQAFLQLGLTDFVQGYAATRQTPPLAPSGQGYYSTALLSLAPGQSLEQARQAFAELEAKTRQEAGNRAFVVQAVQSGTQTQFVIWEHFSDEAAFQAHLKSPALQHFLGLNLVSFEKGYQLQPIA